MFSKFRRLRIISPSESFGGLLITLQYTSVVNKDPVALGCASLGADIEMRDSGRWVEL